MRLLKRVLFDGPVVVGLLAAGFSGPAYFNPLTATAAQLAVHLPADGALVTVGGLLLMWKQLKHSDT